MFQQLMDGFATALAPTHLAMAALGVLLFFPLIRGLVQPSFPEKEEVGV